MTTEARSTEDIVRVEGLSLAAGPRNDPTPLVSGVGFTVGRGEAVGLVGESGSGKSLTLRSLIGLLPRGVRVVDGRAGAVDESADGPRIAMIFQDSLSVLNPTRRVVDIIADGVISTEKCSRREARRRAVELMRDVGIPTPEERARAWPHELSGGLRQRVGIAVALSIGPDILLCDEPTTALDVTVQRQILELLDRLRRERNMSLVFVSHDLAVVAQLCSRIMVFYAGQVVESAPTAAILSQPAHMYTRALIDARVEVDRRSEEFRPIPGQPPNPSSYTESCRFAPRCAAAITACRTALVSEIPIGPDHTTTCIRSEDIGAPFIHDRDGTAA